MPARFDGKSRSSNHNPEIQTIYILAGITESIEIVVYPNDTWKFENECGLRKLG
jgi:hypothetical protein